MLGGEAGVSEAEDERTSIGRPAGITLTRRRGEEREGLESYPRAGFVGRLNVYITDM